MRIFLAIENSTNIYIPENKTWYRNFYEPLVDMGHDVVLFSTSAGRQAMQKNDPNLREQFSQNMVSAFTDAHKKKPFDFAFFYLMNGMFNPWAIEVIKKSGVPTSNFSCNNIHQFELVEGISALFDFNLYSEKHAKEKFDRIGVKSIWWPMASNPKYFHPVPCERTATASFVGGRYGTRLASVYQLLLNGIDVKAYGPGWDAPNSKPSPLRLWLRRSKRSLLGKNEQASVLKVTACESATSAENDLHRYILRAFPGHLCPPVSDQELLTLYSKSKVTLGFLGVLEHHDPLGKELVHVHLREFEAAMAGALYCTDYSDELAECFEPNKEMLLCFGDTDRAEKIKFYLENESQANRIREAALKRALAEHTYHHRFRTLFKEIGLGA